ncbi:nucleotidyltransferase [Roseateles sp. DAIF2]|uniref:nucleotidyltransferase domain-containing protein n=1 Tax=Roseateles sp. DAIF2 TaxID=2714952 RepID=UPI0018A2BE07|nr:nucleotidyltransferase [Roseateles sp. DAIF2]QPF72262.1 nucleotidyltransferase [Roseateles sp. DAIF2]
MAVVLPDPQRRQFTQRASARFFHLVDAVGEAHEPTATQLDALASSYQGLGEFLTDCPEFRGLLKEVHPQGSRELGTLVRPLDAGREGVDIDLVAMMDEAAIFKYGSSDGPARLINDFHAACLRYAMAHELTVKRHDRCVTLHYAGGMTADVTPMILAPSIVALHGETCARIPDRTRQNFNLTNPRGYAKRFSTTASISPRFTTGIVLDSAFRAGDKAGVAPLPDTKDVFPRLLSRFVQLLKLNRNVSFGLPTGGENVAPASVFLTSLCLEAYKDLAPLPHASPLDLMLHIIESLPRYFQIEHSHDGTEHWLLQNPTAQGDNLASSMNSRSRQQAFRLWHAKAQRDIEAILIAIESPTGLDTLLLKIEAAFGERAVRAVRAQELQGQAPTRTPSRVAIVAGTGATFATTSRAHSNFGD